MVMALPFTLPDWAPPWASFVIVSIAVLFLLAFLLMPFSVFGLKGRLDGLEVRLDEIQNDIRSLAMRVPDGRRVEYEPEPELAPPPRASWSEATSRPPLPPLPAPLDSPPPPPNQRVTPGRGVRSEPRLGPN